MLPSNDKEKLRIRYYINTKEVDKLRIKGKVDIVEKVTDAAIYVENIKHNKFDSILFLLGPNKGECSLTLNEVEQTVDRIGLIFKEVNNKNAKIKPDFNEDSYFNLDDSRHYFFASGNIVEEIKESISDIIEKEFDSRLDKTAIFMPIYDEERLIFQAKNSLN